LRKRFAKIVRRRIVGEISDIQILTHGQPLSARGAPEKKHLLSAATDRAIPIAMEPDQPVFAE
jgi:hypothetical protein